MISENFEKVALGLIAQRRLAEAKVVLERAVAEKPHDWRPAEVTERWEVVHVWDEYEFQAYCEFRNYSAPEQPIIWKSGSYAHAYYWLAHIAVEEGNLESALFNVECGLLLEPDHPELLCEKGHILQLRKRHMEALKCYREAESARPWALPTQVARALRGQAYSLVESHQLEEAYEVLQRALKLEPESAVAQQELAHIERLRCLEKEPPRLPWFVHAIVHPPEDPLTVSILEWVEDLPSLSGPKIVGRANYTRIREAFEARGWEGFEEEFKKLYPEDQANYRQVKEDLLREPIFQPKVHQRMCLLFETLEPGDEDSVRRAMDAVRQTWKEHKPIS